MNLSSDKSCQNIVSPEQMELIIGIFRGLGLEYGCGYHEAEGESWLRIDHDGRHMIFVVQGVQVDFCNE